MHYHIITIHDTVTLKLLTEAGSLIQAGYPTEAGCHLMMLWCRAGVKP